MECEAFRIRNNLSASEKECLTVYSSTQLIPVSSYLEHQRPHQRDAGNEYQANSVMCPGQLIRAEKIKMSRKYKKPAQASVANGGRHRWYGWNKT